MHFLYLFVGQVMGKLSKHLLLMFNMDFNMKINVLMRSCDLNGIFLKKSTVGFSKGALWSDKGILEEIEDGALSISNSVNSVLAINDLGQSV